MLQENSLHVRLSPSMCVCIWVHVYSEAKCYIIASVMSWDGDQCRDLTSRGNLWLTSLSLRGPRCHPQRVLLAQITKHRLESISTNTLNKEHPVSEILYHTIRSDPYEYKHQQYQWSSCCLHYQDACHSCAPLQHVSILSHSHNTSQNKLSEVTRSIKHTTVLLPPSYP